MLNKATGSILCITGVLMLLMSLDARAVDVTVDPATKYQTIEGFGGGFMYRMYPYGKVYEKALYDSIFEKAGVNLLRIANNYDSTKEANDDTIEINMLKGIQTKYPDVKVMMASWSPPPYLKNRDTIAGAVYDKIPTPTTDNPDSVTTVKRRLSLKMENGEFVYGKYASYWYNSVKDFLDQGAKLDWISMQNEPDWPADWDGCLFLPQENKTDTIAAYGKALDSVYAKVSTLGVEMIGTDMTGNEGIKQADGTLNTIFTYMDALDTAKLAAISHHYYNGETVAYMDSVKKRYSGKPRFQTEWLTNDNANRAGQNYIWTWYNHMQVLHNALTVEEVSAYCLFALAFGVNSTHTFFSQDPATGTYLTRPIYYAFKQYSKSIKRGWKRMSVAAGTGGDSLMVSAFSGNGDSSMAIVIINKSNLTDSITLTGIPAQIDSGVVHQTTRWGTSATGYDQSRKYECTAVFGKSVPVVKLDPFSITTVTLYNAAYPLPAEEKYGKCEGCSPDLAEVHYQPVKRTTALFDAVYRKNSISITFNADKHQTYSVSLYTVSGREVSSAKSIGSASGKVSYTMKCSFARGAYLVRLTSQSGMEATRTVVVP